VEQIKRSAAPGASILFGTKKDCVYESRRLVHRDMTWRPSGFLFLKGGRKRPGTVRRESSPDPAIQNRQIGGADQSVKIRVHESAVMAAYR